MKTTHCIPKLGKGWFLCCLLIACGENAGQTKDNTGELTARPVIVTVNDLGDKKVKGWISQPGPDGYTLHWKANDGSSIWFQALDTDAFDKAIALVAESNGFEEVTVLASEALKNDTMIDGQGQAKTILAKGTKKGKIYRLALLLFYGRLLEGEPRSMGVHAYAAPESAFVSAGGWVVPATFWLGVDPTKDVGHLVQQGSKPAGEQARIFAALSDLWLQSIYDQYINQMQIDLQSLHNFRISVIAAGDPNAIVIPGANGYNEIEYKY